MLAIVIALNSICCNFAELNSNTHVAVDKLTKITKLRKVSAQANGRDGAQRHTIATAKPTEPIGSKFSLIKVFNLGILLPWLYFMAISVNIPNLPKYVNWAINNGNTDVSPRSAMVYGLLSGTDSFFTLLSVNLVGCLSDVYGRRPFMLLSAAGLGLAYTITSAARQPWLFYVAAMIDGLTSCMFAQAQAYATDCSDGSENLSVILGRFQGIAVGMAFMIGIPLGGILGSKVSLRAPLHLSMAICAVNALLIWSFLPESVKLDPSKKKHINWREASPLGAVRMISRSRTLTVGSFVYLLLNIAHAGVQINWINYLQHRFGWPATKSGSTLLLVGLLVAVMPKLFV
jgi:DHA1 family tetracycline resistance protein-like MFS transporter